MDIKKKKKRKGSGNVGDPNKLQLPLSKVKNIAKMDPDVKHISKKACLALGKAMELFLAKHTKEALKISKSCGRKGISGNDVASAVYENDAFDFLRTQFKKPSMKRKITSAKKTRSKKKQKISKVKSRRLDSFFKKKEI